MTNQKTKAEEFYEGGGGESMDTAKCQRKCIPQSTCFVGKNRG